MGEVRAVLRVENTLDATKPGLEIDGLVDTGAVMPMLPKDVIDKLGIPVIDKAVVTLANEQSEEMDVAGPVTMIIGDRKMFGSCLAGAVKSEPLVGQLVLESLDLIVDCSRNTLRSRPESPAYPSYKLKSISNRKQKSHCARRGPCQQNPEAASGNSVEMKPIDLLKTETDRIEWKETGKDTNDLLRAVCALANDLGNSREDGYLVIGARKDGTPVGIKDTQLDEMQRRLNDLLSSTKILPTPAFDIRVEEHAGRSIVIVRVKPYPAPPVVMVNQTAWVRKGSVTTRAREADLLRLRERRPENSQPFDLRIQPVATLDDLDKKGLFTRYEMARDDDEDRDTFPGFESWLTQQQLGRMGIGEMWRPNPAALLIFGANPPSFFPGAIVEFVRYDGTDIDDPIAFRKTITGTLTDQLDTIWMQLGANLVERPVEENGMRLEFLPDYPIEALKELARNLVQHRLYEGTHSPGRIEWYADRVEFHNPGGPFGHASEGEFGETSDYRNPIITGKLAEYGYVQRLGRGIRRVRQLLVKNGNPPLEVETDGYTHVIVRARS